MKDDFITYFVLFSIIFIFIFIVGFCCISRNIKKTANQLEIIKIELLKEKEAYENNQ